LESATPFGRSTCSLCTEQGGLLVWHADKLRVVRVLDDAFPAFYRVIWNAHVAEFSDLSAGDRHYCIESAVHIERVLRARLHPTKINLALLGNMVPHVHWHVIARFDWDSHFPAPIWGPPHREVIPPAVQRFPVTLDALDAAVSASFE
jgi:diadenosine tetraphosphate (Ap4A) HIT family hydrolase